MSKDDGTDVRKTTKLAVAQEELKALIDDDLSNIDALREFDGPASGAAGTLVVPSVAGDVQRAISAGVSMASALIEPLPASPVARLETPGLPAYVVTQSVVIIGRSKEVCDLAMPEDEEISRQHAALIYAKGDFYVEDLQSSNGTFIDEKRVLRAKLRFGNTLRVGRRKLRLSFSSK